MDSTNNLTDKSQDDLQRSEKIAAQKLPIFINLVKFKEKKVTVVLTNGATIFGKLVSYDEASNLVLEKCSNWKYGKNVVCLGRCLSMISLGEKSIL